MEFKLIHKMFCIAFVLANVGYAAEKKSPLPEACAQLVAGTQKSVVAGKDGWLFLKSELRHLSVGAFWGDASAKTSLATKASWKDPLPAIVDYHNRLKAEGIQLLLMPIPPKAAIYPDKLPVDLAWNATRPVRLDTHHVQFYKTLTDSGVHVIDIAPLLLKARTQSAEPLYCARDSHYSPAACTLIASHLAKILKAQPVFSNLKPKSFDAKQIKTTIRGDLAEMAQLPPNTGAEPITLRLISGEGTKDPSSPVLLFGDSHNLVFETGGRMHAIGGGLPSQLAYELGIGIDVMGVFGSGATPSRINIYRRSKSEAGFLKKKKVFVWCFTAREFTEGSGWSAKIPVKPR
jgi:hypothetical protein